MTLPRGLLLVEDDVLDVELVSEALRRVGVAEAPAVVPDGSEALDYLRRAGAHAGRSGPQPRLVLLDIKMPRMDGVETLRRIKQDPHLRAIPVVMLSSSRVVADVSACYRLGLNGYVVKPPDFAALVETMRRVAGFWLLANEPAPEA